MSARRRSKTGALALKIGLMCSIAAAVVCVIAVAGTHRTLSSGISIEDADILTQGWTIGLILAAICGVVVGLVAYFQGAAIASRVTELGLGVAKLGRGNDVRMRFSGNDEISAITSSQRSGTSDFLATRSRC